jgi:hypothetical protein
VGMLQIQLNSYDHSSVKVTRGRALCTDCSMAWRVGAAAILLSRIFPRHSAWCLRARFQAFITYGRQGNDRLLQFYGFVEADNPADAYVMLDLDAKIEVMPLDIPAPPLYRPAAQRLCLAAYSNA